MSNTARINALDIAKGLGIILVIFAHVNYTPSILIAIYSFHMPLFFLLAGMVFKREKHPTFRMFLARRLRTLIVPYVIYSVLSIGYVYLCDVLFPGAYDLKRTEYLSAVAQIFLAQGSGPVLNTPLWFVPCLFAVEIMYYLISRMKKGQIAVVCAALTAVGWLLESDFCPFDNTLLPWTFDTALFSIGFYAIGNLSADRAALLIRKTSVHTHRAAICLTAVFLCAAVGFPLAFLNGKVSLGSRVLNNGLLFYATGILGTAALLALGVFLQKNRALEYLGKNTFAIMSVHYMIRKYVLQNFYRICDIPLYRSKVLRETIVPFIIVFALTLLAVAVINRLLRLMRVQAKKA